MEHLTRWTRPESYGGYSPEGDYVIYSRTRDDGVLTNTNYDRILEDLTATAAEVDPADSWDTGDDSQPWVHDFRASHWAVGWVETIIVRADAPQPILDAATETVCALADYPIYDELAHSEAAWDAMVEAWETMSLRERVDMCTEHGLSAFAARRFPMGDGADGLIEDMHEYAEVYA